MSERTEQYDFLFEQETRYFTSMVESIKDDAWANWCVLSDVEIEQIVLWLDTYGAIKAQAIEVLTEDLDYVNIQTDVVESAKQIQLRPWMVNDPDDEAHEARVAYLDFYDAYNELMDDFRQYLQVRPENPAMMSFYHYTDGNRLDYSAYGGYEQFQAFLNGLDELTERLYESYYRWCDSVWDLSLQQNQRAEYAYKIMNDEFALYPPDRLDITHGICQQIEASRQNIQECLSVLEENQQHMSEPEKNLLSTYKRILEAADGVQILQITNPAAVWSFCVPKNDIESTRTVYHDLARIYMDLVSPLPQEVENSLAQLVATLKTMRDDVYADAVDMPNLNPDRWEAMSLFPILDNASVDWIAFQQNEQYYIDITRKRSKCLQDVANDFLLLYANLVPAAHSMYETAGANAYFAETMEETAQEEQRENNTAELFNWGDGIFGKLMTILTIIFALSTEQINAKDILTQAVMSMFEYLPLHGMKDIMFNKNIIMMSKGHYDSLVQTLEYCNSGALDNIQNASMLQAIEVFKQSASQLIELYQFEVVAEDGSHYYSAVMCDKYGHVDWSYYKENTKTPFEALRVVSEARGNVLRTYMTILQGLDQHEQQQQQRREAQANGYDNGGYADEEEAEWEYAD